MRRSTVLLTALALTLTLTACSGDDSGGVDAVAETEGGPMASALALVPTTDDEGALVVVNDYAAAGAALDLDRPSPDEADEDSVADWFIPLTTGRDDVVGGLTATEFLGSRVTEDEAWRDELGWAPVDVDLAVELQTEEGPGYSAFTGDFDADTIEDAVTAEDNVWADELEVEEQGDTEYYRWGDDEAAIDPDRVTTVRPLGRGGSMAVFEGTVLWSWRVDELEAGIDAATGEGDSIGDDEELAAMAEAMDGLGAMGAVFTSDEEILAGPPIPGLDDVDRTSLDGPVLEPYEALATGVRIGEDGQQVLVALLHDDEDDAAENVDALEEVVEDGTSLVTNRAWSDQVSVDEIEADGPVLTAVLDLEDGGAPNLWINMLYTRDTLLAT